MCVKLSIIYGKNQENDPTTTGRMLYNRVGSETQRPWKCLLCYTTGREITIREVTEWITRHNRGYHLSHQKDSVWTVSIEPLSLSLLTVFIVEKLINPGTYSTLNVSAR